MANDSPRKKLSPLFSWRTAIVKSGLPSQARLVALCLSLYMNERGGSCFPSQATLAVDAGISERQVRRHLRCLREEQWLMVQYRESPKGRRAFYRATVPIEGLLPDGAAHPPDADDLWDEDTHDL